MLQNHTAIEKTSCFLFFLLPFFIAPPAALANNTPAIQQEKEDNDAVATASALSLSTAGLAGTFQGGDKRDNDFFYIESDEDQVADLYIEADTEIDFDISLFGVAGKEQEKYRAHKDFALKRLFLAKGKNTLKLSAYLKDETPYRLYVYNPAPLEDDAESEPNDTLSAADTFQQGRIFKGRLGKGDKDVIALEATAPLSIWRVDVNGTDISSVKYLSAAGDPLIHARLYENGLSHVGLPSLLLTSGLHYFEVKGNGHYRITARQTADAPPEVLSRHIAIDPAKTYAEIEPNDQPGLSMRLSDGQTREGLISFGGDEDYYRFSLDAPAEVEMTITSPDPAPLIASLDWGMHQKTNLARRNITDDTRPQAITFREQLEAGDYLLNVRARAAMEMPYTLTYEVLSKQDAPAATIPDALLGRLSAQKAGWRVGAQSAKKLLDGTATYGSSALLRLQKPYEILIEGDHPLPLAGVIIDTRHGHAPGVTLKSFRLEAETEGGERITLLEKMLPVREDVYGFEIEPNPSVRKLYLSPLSAGAEKSGNVYLGELTLIPSGANNGGELRPLDLLRSENGGQILYAPPFIVASHMLEQDGRVSYLNVPSKYSGALFWVAGFHGARTAEIVKLSWAETTKAKDDDLIGAVNVYASADSPDGPWHSLGTFKRADDGQMRDIVLEQPYAARYLKYVIPRDPPSRRRWILPDKLAALERAPLGEYRSILGEWGGQVPDEKAQVKEYEDSDMLRHSGARDVFSLPLAMPVAGMVEHDKRVDLYDITVPAGMKTLSLTFRHPQMVSVQPTLTTQDGERVTLNLVEDSYNAQNQHVRLYNAIVMSGEYRLEVSEAPLSLAVAWDTSGSVSNFRADIINAVRSVARYAAPEHVMINLFPFRNPESKPLLRKWSGDPATIYTSLQHYSWSDNASNVEGALIGASKSLQEQPGSRAIILVTDGATSGGRQGAESWQAVNALKPRIFVTAIPGSGGAKALEIENYLQHYARSYNGNYTILSGQNTFERGFEQVIESLSDPKDYVLEAAASDQLPKPGFLKFEASPQNQKIELEKDLLIVLDVSGSMLQRLEGTRRIDVARDAIEDVMASAPHGLKVGLRTLGGASADLCDTQLHIPISPFNTKTLNDVLSGITPVDGAKTPIAKALLQAQQDFTAEDQATQKDKMILLITDGEETCDGNPLEAIQTLQQSDFDVTVNIVGFAVDAAEIKDQFMAFAKAGGGQYFDAENAEKISAALTSALLPAFQVEDKNGTIVARGTMGHAAIELLPGTYNLTLHTNPPQHFYDIEIKSGETVTLDSHLIE